MSLEMNANLTKMYDFAKTAIGHEALSVRSPPVASSSCARPSRPTTGPPIPACLPAPIC